MDMLDMGPPSHPGFDTMGPDPVMMQHMGLPGPQQRMMAQQPQTPQRMGPPAHMMQHDPMHMPGAPGSDHMGWFGDDM
jgi:hypothetical protein